MISEVSSTDSVVWVMYATGVRRGAPGPRPRRRPDEHRGVGRFSHRPDHLLVPGMADQDDRVAVGGVRRAWT